MNLDGKLIITAFNSIIIIIIITFSATGATLEHIHGADIASQVQFWNLLHILNVHGSTVVVKK